MQNASHMLNLLGCLFLVVAIAVGLYYAIRYRWPPTPARPVSPMRRRPQTLEEWALLADEHSGYAPGHARRVADLALALAEALALAPGERPALEHAALLHDVGEIDLAPDLMRRPGPLTPAETTRLWGHAARGAQIALEVTGSATVAQWVRWHHENWDGLGYPDGLAGTAIPLPARILRLADSANAMLQPRPYRPAMTPEQVLAELDRLSGICYDPEVARIFVDYVLPRLLAGIKSV